MRKTTNKMKSEWLSYTLQSDLKTCHRREAKRATKNQQEEGFSAALDQHQKQQEMS